MPKPIRKKSKSSKAAGKKKSAAKSKTAAKPAVRATFTRVEVAEAALAGAPAPQLCPKEEVGNVVQDFIDFGGATAVTSAEQPDGQWLVQAV